MSRTTRPPRNRRSNSEIQFEQLEPRQLLAADVTIGWQQLNAQPLLGETINVSFEIENTGDEAGFGPFIDVLVPGGDAPNEGLQYVYGSANLLDAGLKETVVQFGTDGLAMHPFATDGAGNALIVEGNVNDQLVVLELPFGSFATTQPTMQVEFQLVVDANADVGEALRLESTGGFRYGSDPLDNVTDDPVIFGASAAIEIIPEFVRTEIEYLGPENETATGENYLRSYRVSFDMVEGGSVDDLNVVTQFDTNEVYMGIRETSWGDQSLTVVSQPPAGQAGFNHELVLAAASWEGVAGIDGSFIIDVYVPMTDAAGEMVVDPVAGNDSVSTIAAFASGSWIRIEATADEPADRVEFVSTPAVHELQGELLAVQQSVLLKEDNNSKSLGPGDLLEYMIEFQVSDFAVLDDLTVTFSIPDGQKFVDSHAGLLTLTGLAATDGASREFNISFKAVESSSSGQQYYLAEIAGVLKNSGLDSRLAGGATEDGQGIAVTGSITYQAIVQDQFLDTVPSGDASIDEGDLMVSHVNANAVTINPATGERTAFRTADNSGTRNQLKVAEVNTSVFAVNGSQNLENLVVTADDLVTFRIARDLTSSDIENLILSEFLPMPVFSIDSLQWSSASHNNLAENLIQLGPSDSFHSQFNLYPEIEVDLSNNSFSLNYGDIDWSENQTTTIDLLVTIRVQDQPFADGMWLSSLANSSQGSSNNGNFTSNAIANIQYARPSLAITKSAVGSSNGAAQLVEAERGGTDIQGVDAGDIVSFEIAVENTGSSQNGAHNALIHDSLPNGFVIPGAGLNLQVVDAGGNVVEYRLTGTQSSIDLFGNGIELVNPVESSRNGNAAGRVLIRYDLMVADDVQPNLTVSSNAMVIHYAAIEGGENYVTSAIEDAASAATSQVSLSHTVINSDQAHTTGRNVVIGETVTYKTLVKIPEGGMQQALLQFNAPRGMAFNELISVGFPNAITVEGQDAASIVANATITDQGTNVRNGGRIMTLQIGNLVNADRDNGTAEFFEIVYTATVTNDPGNDAGDSRRNTAIWTHLNGRQLDTSQSVKILEPGLEVVKFWNVDTADAGDSLMITLEIVSGQKLGSTAFDVQLLEQLPAGTKYVPGSLRWVSGAIPGEFSSENDLLKVQWESISNDQSSVLTYEVIVDGDTHAGTTLTNDATISWSSLRGTPGQIAATNDLSFERTGNVADVGGTANDYVADYQSSLSISPVQLTMNLVETSHIHTTGNALTIGERAEYEIVMTVPEGVHNLTLSSSNVGNESVLDLESLVVLSIGGNLSIEKADVGTRVTVDENGMINLDLGAVRNAVDNIANSADQVVFRLFAIVPDVGENQSGDVAVASVELDFQHGIATEYASVNVVEPSLEIRQVPGSQNVDATDTIDVSIVISHVNGNSSGAFILELNEALADAGLTLIPGSVSVEGGQVIAGNGENDLQIQVNADSLANSGVIKVTYQAVVAADATPGSTLTLAPILSYASLSGSTGRDYYTSASTEIQINETIIAGTVFVDANQDGVAQFGDHGIGEVTVELVGINHLGETVAIQVQTAASGEFQFTGLRPGNYSLIETQPAGYSDGADYAEPLNGDVTQDRVESIVIDAGHSGTFGNYRFTESPLTWIEGTVFVDENQDGTLGEDENGIEGIKIGLSGFNQLGEAVQRTALTNYRGYYVFEYLEPGIYQLTEGDVAGYFDASEQLGSNGGVKDNDFFAGIEVNAESPGKMYNFGEYAPASLTGQIYIDYDRDYVLDRKDGLVAGVEVKLTGRNDLGEDVTAIVQSDVDGFYRFGNLRPGEYHVSSESLEGLVGSISNVGLFLGKFARGVENGVGIENGFEKIQLPAGAQAQAYNVGHVDPLYQPSIKASDFTVQNVIHGSSSGDQFVASFSDDEATISVNGVDYFFDGSETRSVRLLGSFGEDSLIFTGSENKETVELRRHSARITGTWFESLIYGMENIHFVGGGNEDLARFYDTQDDEQFDGEPFNATMTGEGFRNSVEGIHRIYSYMTEGFDSVSFIGQQGVRDNFSATPESAKLYGTEFYLRATNFDTVQATGTDSVDRAYLHGSAKVDQLNAGEDTITLSGENYRIDANNFTYAIVSAGQGDDSAILEGSTGDDQFRSRPTESVFDIRDTRVTTKGFEKISVSANGGHDVARVHDSQHDDLLVADANQATISNSVNETTMIGFDRVYSYMEAGGSDVALVGGSGGSDVFKASPTDWTMEGGGKYLYGRGFTTVTASANSNDKAYLYDSAYNDTLQLSDTGAELSGQRFSNSATGFGKVNAEASSGNDRVVFTESSSRSTIRMNEQKASIFGAGFSYNASGFDAIDAFFSSLNDRDNVELDGRIGYDLLAVDNGFANYKLSLLLDADFEHINVKSRIARLY